MLRIGWRYLLVGALQPLTTVLLICRVNNQRSYDFSTLRYDSIVIRFYTLCLSVCSLQQIRPGYHPQHGKRWNAMRQPFARFPSLMGMRFTPAELVYGPDHWEINVLTHRIVSTIDNFPPLNLAHGISEKIRHPFIKKLESIPIIPFCSAAQKLKNF